MFNMAARQAAGVGPGPGFYYGFPVSGSTFAPAILNA